MADKSVQFTLKAVTADAQARLDDVNARIEKLTAGTKNISVFVDDLKARAALDDLAYRVQRMSDKTITPNIELKGYFKTLAELDRLELKMAEVSRMGPTGGSKFWSALSFLPGLEGAGGGTVAAATNTGAAATPAAATPWGAIGIGAAITAGALAAPALLGGAMTLLTGGGALAGALLLGSRANTALTALQATQTSAQQSYTSSPTAANRTALDQANAAVAAYQKQNAPALSAYSAMSSVGSAGSTAFLSALTSGGAHSALSDVTKLLGQVAGFIKDITPGLGKLLQAGSGGLLEFVRGVEPALKQIVPMIAQFTQAFQPFAGQLGHSIGNVILDIVRGLRNLEPGFRASAQIVSIFADVLGGAFDLVARVVGDTVRLIYDLLTGKWRDAWKAGVDIISYAITGMETVMGHVFDYLGEWGGKFVTTVENALSGLAGKLFQIGVDAIQGLINGIDHMAGAVLGSISHIASSIGSGIMHILGIGSPSKVMHEIGTYVAQGLALGMTDSTPFVVTASRQLSAAVTGGIGVGGGGGYGSGRMQVVLSVAPGADASLAQALLQVIRAQVQMIGGGGPNSVQHTYGRA